MNPTWGDSEVEIQRRIAVHERRIEETEGDLDKLGGAMRDAAKEIGARIDGFRDSCHEEVEGVHREIKRLRDDFAADLTALREETVAKEEKRKWTRPELLMTGGLILTFCGMVAGLIFG